MVDIDNENSNSSVYVAVSGGVDSSVSAALLKSQGYDVTGAFMRVWEPPFLDCDWKKDRQDAMRVCAQLGIDFEEFDLSEEYKRDVVDYMIREYKAGRTPNPDVMCNKRIKFGAFFKAAKAAGADMVATGHYAQKREIRSAKSEIRNVHLLRGEDEHKDQTYFLWTLEQEQLQDTVFPVGEYEKSQVREMAKEHDLFTHEKSDSQGLCFLGHVDMQDFLAEFVETEEGAILNESGEKIGTHDGAIFYTLGQRRGFDVKDKTPDAGPWYVAEKNMEENTITVTEDTSKTGPLYNATTIKLKQSNWIANPPEETKTYQAKIRYNQPAQPCTLQQTASGEQSIRQAQDTWAVVFEEPQRAAALGQSCVVYDKEICIGGGVIDEIKDK